jgi:sugar transferase (PEP-CTERM/EpsH1 system associated)
MNILFLSTENPYPPDHGHHLRTYHVLRHLAAHHKIFFVGFWQSEEELKHKAHLESLCASVDLLPIPGRARKARYALSLFGNLFSSWPFTVRRYFRREAVARIRQIAQEHRIDLVHFDLMHLAPYLECIGDTPNVLVNHNVESLRLERLAQVQKNFAARAYLNLQLRKMRRLEQERCRRFTQLVAVSETDAEILRDTCNLDNNIEEIPNGVDADFFDVAEGKPEPDSLVWTGGMGSPYNRDAVDYFLEDIFPKIYVQRPQIKVTIVGDSPSPTLQQYQARYPQNIFIGGYVDDVRPYMQRASIFIAPMRCGSGTKVKVINAMAMGKAIVSSSVGAEGIKVESGKDLIIADAPQEFADQVLQLLQDPARLRQLGENARQVVERYYDWRVIYKKMDALYEKVASGKRVAKATAVTGQTAFENARRQYQTAVVGA